MWVRRRSDQVFALFQLPPDRSVDDFLSVVGEAGKGSKESSMEPSASEEKRTAATPGSSKPQKRIIVTVPSVEDMDEDGNVSSI